MIRESFKVNAGIIFDAHMLKHEVGLDIDSLFEAPQPLRPAAVHLAGPDAAELPGFTLRKIPVAIISTLASPFRWVGSKLPHLRLHSPPKVPFSLEQTDRFTYEGEAREELDDAMSPVYDQLKKHTYWKVMEWIPWIMKKQGAELDEDIWAYKLVWNRGKGRKVYHRVMQRGMKVHRSVKTRMMANSTEGENKPYWPHIRCMINGEARRLTRAEWLAEQPEFFEWVDDARDIV